MLLNLILLYLITVPYLAKSALHEVPQDGILIRYRKPLRSLGELAEEKPDQDCKISPILGSTCPEGSRKLRFPDYVTMAHDGGKVVSLTHRPLLPTGNTPGTVLISVRG